MRCSGALSAMLIALACGCHAMPANRSLHSSADPETPSSVAASSESKAAHRVAQHESSIEDLSDSERQVIDALRRRRAATEAAATRDGQRLPQGIEIVADDLDHPVRPGRPIHRGGIQTTSYSSATPAAQQALVPVPATVDPADRDRTIRVASLLTKLVKEDNSPKANPAAPPTPASNLIGQELARLLDTQGPGDTPSTPSASTPSVANPPQAALRTGQPFAPNPHESQPTPAARVAAKLPVEFLEPAPQPAALAAPVSIQPRRPIPAQVPAATPTPPATASQPFSAAVSPAGAEDMSLKGERKVREIPTEIATQIPRQTKPPTAIEALTTATAEVAPAMSTTATPRAAISNHVARVAPAGRSAGQRRLLSVQQQLHDLTQIVLTCDPTVILDGANPPPATPTELRRRLAILRHWATTSLQQIEAGAPPAFAEGQPTAADLETLIQQLSQLEYELVLPPQPRSSG